MQTYFHLITEINFIVILLNYFQDLVSRLIPMHEPFTINLPVLLLKRYPYYCYRIQGGFLLLILVYPILAYSGVSLSMLIHCSHLKKSTLYHGFFVK